MVEELANRLLQRRRRPSTEAGDILFDHSASRLVRPDPTRLSSSKVHCEETTTFRTISGASVSANTSTPLSTAFVDLYSYGSIDRAAAFESSTSFASLPPQPIPINLMNSSPFSGILEETTDYISALEMEVRAMNALTEQLGGDLMHFFVVELVEFCGCLMEK